MFSYQRLKSEFFSRKSYSEVSVPFGKPTVYCRQLVKRVPLQICGGPRGGLNPDSPGSSEAEKPTPTPTFAAPGRYPLRTPPWSVRATGPPPGPPTHPAVTKHSG